VWRARGERVKICREAVLLELPLDELPNFKHAAGRISIVCQPSASFVVVVRRMYRRGYVFGLMSLVGGKKNSSGRWPLNEHGLT